MSLAERIRRLSIWLAYQLAPKSPVFNRDEQMASVTLYPSRRRGAQATPIKAPATRSTSRRATEEETLDGTAV